MSVGRSSALIAAGTLASRVTGLLRSVVLVMALGAIGQSADAFAIANQLPNYVFQVISTGVITAVFVPLIVRWSQTEDGGRRLIGKLFTLGTIVLLGVTAVAMLAAPLLVRAFSDFGAGDQFDLSVAFALWCLPQVFFYGMFALVGETLNARGVFGPYAWAPIVNNLVSIAGFGLFIWLHGGGQRPAAGWTPDMIFLVGGTATLGIVAQTVVLAIFWRRTGVRLRPDFRFRGMGLGEVRGVAGWSVGMLLVGLAVSSVQQQIITTASGDNASSAVWFNAWLVFMLPYSLIVMSIGTPYFTRLSEHASLGRDDDVRADIDKAVRTLGVLVVFAAVTLGVACVPAARIFANNLREAQVTAPVLLAFLFGLVPMAVLFIVQRTFYAYGDTRTPFFFTLFQAALTVGGAFLARWLFADGGVAFGVAFMQAAASTLQTLLAIWLLKRKLGQLRLGRAIWALIRFTLASIPTAAAGFFVYSAMDGAEGWMADSKILAVLGCAVIGSVCALVYGGVLAAFRAPELTALVRLARAKIGR